MANVWLLASLKTTEASSLEFPRWARDPWFDEGWCWWRLKWQLLQHHLKAAFLYEKLFAKKSSKFLSSLAAVSVISLSSMASWNRKMSCFGPSFLMSSTQTCPPVPLWIFHTKRENLLLRTTSWSQSQWLVSPSGQHSKRDKIGFNVQFTPILTPIHWEVCPSWSQS